MQGISEPSGARPYQETRVESSRSDGRTRRLELFAEARALHELADTGRRDELVVFDEHLPAQQNDLRRAGHRRPLEEVVVHLRVVLLRGDRDALLRIEDNEVG